MSTYFKPPNYPLMENSITIFFKSFFKPSLSLGSDFSYPNLNTYMTSYLRTNTYNQCLQYKNFILLIATKMVVQGASMPFIGNWAKKLGTKVSILIGSGLYSFGYLMTYFSIQHHFYLAVFTMSLHGLAFGFIYATSIKAVQVKIFHLLYFYCYSLCAVVVSCLKKGSDCLGCCLRIWVWLQHLVTSANILRQP